ncbi:MAG: TonB-dependent receptor [Gemmatimonadetes bacterium]|jgi:iron complex outermembrane recepter protein|nr:TonB-dependent receptor [Gemmatimonadota bacterium]MBT5055194.1 TonB-dependent receptor [Gemmatimonadota bacterium]MBT5143077.1 TonB-dependent receptor [Gemmatimonadota bacterium]MBT5588342.1 TonB-dependent receptor [Gemmatimonadota bacterium]MBT5963502.1 TonB-dependent receptor [Gemmatimonadota bacterium]
MLWLVIALLGFSTSQTMAETINLIGLSLEELMDIPVNLVSRKQERLGQAPAAVAVITGEELRRSGAQTITEALRLVPGMQVARIDANKWAVGSRGFNSRFANKLLVLVDGRNVYSPFFSGVFWEDHDLVLEDIERIEVTRGPGATLWGANAVDGVINVVTRSAVDTQGLLAQVGGGKEERATASVRYGARAADRLYYRVFAKLADRDEFRTQTGRSSNDAWRQGLGGFRADWDHDRDRVMVQGAFYTGSKDYRGESVARNPPYSLVTLSEIETSGGHVLAHWVRQQLDGSELALQTYIDWTRRLESLEERRLTFDIDLQHRLQIGSIYELAWGGAFRTTGDRITKESFAFRLAPSRRRLNLYSAFVQGEVDLVPGQLSLTTGTKFEHNGFTGLEIQPSARVRWTPGVRQTLWASVSRAVRTPSRTDADAHFVVGVVAPTMEFLGLPAPAEGTPPTFLELSGSPDFEAETVRALEAGYRGGLSDRWLIDVSLFRNQYARLADATIGGVTVAAGSDPYAVLPLQTVNGISGTTWGVEAAVDGNLTSWWRIRAGYTRLELDFSSDSGAFLDQLRLDATTPTHQLTLHSSMDWRSVWELDGGLRYVDELSGLGVGEYVELDARIGRSLGSHYDVALIGRNLLAGHHQEFAPTVLSAQSVEIERALFVIMTVRR